MLNDNKKILSLLVGSTMLFSGCDNKEAKADVTDDVTITTTTDFSSNTTTTSSDLNVTTSVKDISTTTSMKITTCGVSSSSKVNQVRTTSLDRNTDSLDRQQVDVPGVTTGVLSTTLTTPVTTSSNNIPLNNREWEYEEFVNSRVLYGCESANMICKQYSMTIDDFISYNPDIDFSSSYISADCINFPSKREYYIARNGDTINSIAEKYGFSIDRLVDLDSANAEYLEMGYIPEGTRVLTCIYDGFTTSYPTTFGNELIYPIRANVVNNNRIICNSVVYDESGRNVLVAGNNPSYYGKNFVKLYMFDDNDNITNCIDICNNCLDIGLDLNGNFMVHLRDEDFVVNYILNGIDNIRSHGGSDRFFNEDFDYTDPLQFVSSDYNSDFLSTDEFGNSCLIFNTYDLNKSKQLVK